ncbi:unnamed protein product [Vitrella brassicaformis CCMP3155]|uniref:Uncharacterized protein n=4 Tax=Vitrella brassicaformis TaxID=1169539 RepID=A0A0G4H254_VITBC|nr:unnamed protein product [Vitrella brassicaformis CCMP3155]|eukprot:CEM37614.1 unnamed protein product [Vitrella brassicaformis CCMP3155]
MFWNRGVPLFCCTENTMRRRDRLTNGQLEGVVLDCNRKGMELLRKGKLDVAFNKLKQAETLLAEAGAPPPPPPPVALIKQGGDLWWNAKAPPEPMDPAAAVKLLAITFNNLGCLYKTSKKYSSSLEYFRQAIRLQQQSSADVCTLAGTHLNISAILSKLHKHDKALRHASTALTIASHRLAALQQESIPPSQDDITTMAIAYHNVGVEKEYLGQYGEATLFFEKGRHVAREGLGEDHPLTVALGKNLDEMEQRASSPPPAASPYLPPRTRSPTRNKQHPRRKMPRKERPRSHEDDAALEVPLERARRLFHAYGLKQRDSRETAPLRSPSDYLPGCRSSWNEGEGLRRPPKSVSPTTPPKASPKQRGLKGKRGYRYAMGSTYRPSPQITNAVLSGMRQPQARPASSPSPIRPPTALPLTPPSPSPMLDVDVEISEGDLRPLSRGETPLMTHRGEENEQVIAASGRELPVLPDRPYSRINFYSPDDLQPLDEPTRRRPGDELSVVAEEPQDASERDATGGRLQLPTMPGSSASHSSTMTPRPPPISKPSDHHHTSSPRLKYIRKWAATRIQTAWRSRQKDDDASPLQAKHPDSLAKHRPVTVMPKRGEKLHGAALPPRAASPPLKRTQEPHKPAPAVTDQKAPNGRSARRDSIATREAAKRKEEEAKRQDEAAKRKEEEDRKREAARLLKERQEKAAIEVQRHARGRMARRSIEKMKQDEAVKKDQHEAVKRDDAARRIQRQMRQRKKRLELRPRPEGEWNDKHFWLQTEIGELERQVRAARIIQKNERRRSAQQRYAELKRKREEAAIRLQACERGRQARRLTSDIKKERADEVKQAPIIQKTETEQPLRDMNEEAVQPAHEEDQPAAAEVEITSVEEHEAIGGAHHEEVEEPITPDAAVRAYVGDLTKSLSAMPADQDRHDEDISRTAEDEETAAAQEAPQEEAAALPVPVTSSAAELEASFAAQEYVPHLIQHVSSSIAGSPRAADRPADEGEEDQPIESKGEDVDTHEEVNAEASEEQAQDEHDHEQQAQGDVDLHKRSEGEKGEEDIQQDTQEETLDEDGDERHELGDAGGDMPGEAQQECSQQDEPSPAYQSTPQAEAEETEAEETADADKGPPVHSETQDLTAAILTVQKHIRGHQARRRMSAVLASKVLGSSWEASQNQLAEEEEAAKKIQAALRVRLARKSPSSGKGNILAVKKVDLNESVVLPRAPRGSIAFQQMPSDFNMSIAPTRAPRGSMVYQQMPDLSQQPQHDPEDSQPEESRQRSEEILSVEDSYADDADTILDQMRRSSIMLTGARSAYRIEADEVDDAAPPPLFLSSTDSDEQEADLLRHGSSLEQSDQHGGDQGEGDDESGMWDEMADNDAPHDASGDGEAAPDEEQPDLAQSFHSSDRASSRNSNRRCSIQERKPPNIEIDVDAIIEDADLRDSRRSSSVLSSHKSSPKMERSSRSLEGSGLSGSGPDDRKPPGRQDTSNTGTSDSSEVIMKAETNMRRVSISVDLATLAHLRQGPRGSTAGFFVKELSKAAAGRLAGSNMGGSQMTGSQHSQGRPVMPPKSPTSPDLGADERRKMLGE